MTDLAADLDLYYTIMWWVILALVVLGLGGVFTMLLARWEPPPRVEAERLQALDGLYEGSEE